MFNNLKSYKDSQDRATLSKYEYGIDCKKKDEYEVAKNTLRSLGDYKDSEAQLCELELNNIDKSEVGTSVLFGEYKWLILEKKQGKAFLVKSEPIPGYAYNDENISVTWEKSSLRKFLNSDFIDETFSESQKSKILETRISIPLNSQSKTKGGKETTDKLFMLNAEQANRYEEILSNYTRDWWLIDAGISDSSYLTARLWIMVTRYQARILTFVRQCGFSISKTNKKDVIIHWFNQIYNLKFKH